MLHIRNKALAVLLISGCTVAGCSPGYSDESSSGGGADARPSGAQLETCNYAGAPAECEPIDMDGDGQYGIGDYDGSEDAGIDDDYDGSVDEYGEGCVGGCDPALQRDEY